MKLLFPSREFDEAVAAVCHGLADDAQMRALHELLRADAAARDEYLLRVEFHSRLASEPGLFASAPDAEARGAQNILSLPRLARRKVRTMKWAVSLAACLALLAALGWGIWLKRPGAKESTSSAVAMLTRAVDARWNSPAEAHAVGAALEPGWLRLKSGLVQVAFYSGARIVIEGPAELRLVSPLEAYCPAGRVTAEVPPQAHGFRVVTPQMTVVDLGTAFGLDARSARAEVHVFKGVVEIETKASAKQSLNEGEAVVVEGNGPSRRIAADASAFASLLDLERKSLATQTLRYEQWRAAGARLHGDPSLVLHFDFENRTSSDWSLHNAATNAPASDGTIVGCQWTEGRWPGKRALEFRSVSDRVRLDVPGEFEALTLAAWVNVKGLDRPFNSIFMCDGFEPGELHWQIRNYGVLDLGVLGARIEDCQIFASPPVVGLDRFGQWMHLAVVLDGPGKRVAHYVNGVAVSQHELKLTPPFRIGEAELGNWNVGQHPTMPPALIRHFSGAMDEFALYNRALSDAEIRQLHWQGKPQPDAEPVAANHQP